MIHAIAALNASSRLKRAIDVAGALAGLVVLSPIMAAAAVVVMFTMGRPVIFRQRRTGKGGVPFTLYKFRTMSAGDHLPDATRLTAAGAALRSLSIDELPQLWNVLRGDMSLVGPRPLLPEYLPRYTSTELRRFEVMPGVTGWAQVHGRNALPWEEKFRLDVWYVDHKSNALDVVILLKTIGQVFTRRGINQPGMATAAVFSRLSCEGRNLQ